MAKNTNDLLDQLADNNCAPLTTTWKRTGRI